MYSRPTIELKIGQLLVQLGYLDERQLEEVLTAQKDQKTYKPLGVICAELGFISRQVLRDILERYNKQILLGGYLLKTGAITQEELDEAIDQQKRSGGKLGQILVRKGSITQSALTDSLSVQLGIAKVSPKPGLIDKTLLNTTNISYYRKRRAVPLRLDKERRILTVAMEDPTDLEAMADMRKLFGAEIEPAICTAGDIDLILNQSFDTWANAR